MLLSKLHTVFVSVQECLTSTHMIHPSFPFLSWPRQRVSSGFKDTQKALLLCDLWSLHKSCHKTCADIFPLVKCMPFKNKKKILKMMQHNNLFLYTRSEIIIISSQHHHASLLTSPKVSSSENILSIFQTSMQTLFFPPPGLHFYPNILFKRRICEQF